jgi:hypothetical protein
MSDYSSLICGPFGERLYPTPKDNPRKYRPGRPLKRDMKLAVSQMDHADLVTNCTQLACSIPILSGALRQMSEWAFAGDSWQPIHFGQNEQWGDIASNWLMQSVYPNAVRRTTNKKLIKAMQVSAKGWLVQGDDLALFTTENGMPKMTVIPGTSIGNGSNKSGWWAATNTVSGYGNTTNAGYGICVGGKFDGFRIYNGIIFDDEDEPIAARVLGWKRVGNDFEEAFTDFQLGFQYGAHLASPYDWHGMGRSLPRLASAVPAWLDFKETDDHFKKGIKLAATKMIIHQLAEGQDGPQARGDAVQQITSTDADGNEQNIWVESTEGGDVTYIGSGEQLKGADFANPHPNVEEFVTRKLRESVFDLGWLFELIDLSSTGRAPTRLGCELVNNSIWQLQTDGDERMTWFTRYAVAVGIQNKHIPAPPEGPLDDPYLWTFGYPKEMSVDAGNDVTASLNRIRFGLTSQRVESAKWGYVLKRIRRDRQKESFSLVDDADALVKYAKAKGHELPFLRAMEQFYMPSANNSSIPNQPAEAKPEEKKKAAAGSNESADKRARVINITKSESKSGVQYQIE